MKAGLTDDGQVELWLNKFEADETYVLCSLMEANLADAGAEDNQAFYKEREVCSVVRLTLEQEAVRERDLERTPPDIFHIVTLTREDAFTFGALCGVSGETLTTISHMLFCRYTKFAYEIEKTYSDAGLPLLRLP
jgi:hypothetical protein